jgi:serine/threonine protein kinase
VALAVGEQLGKYRLIALLGHGGMGEVWCAHDPDLDRKVALKVLKATTAGAADAQARLLREGRAMARLRHPNVITVYEASSAGGRDLIAMELIDGTSLAGWLAVKHAPREVVETLVKAGRGLAAAHAAGMVHRDFKPHNVLVDKDGRVVVTDFGLARAEAETETETDSETDSETETETDSETESESESESESGSGSGSGTEAKPRANPHADSIAVDETLAAVPTPARSTASADRAALHSSLTRTGSVIGTPAYMPPEQIDGRTADARADQFAYCVTAWEALAGRRPFKGASLAELRDAIDAGPTEGAAEIPARLRAVLERGLAPDPLRRWPSMDALLRALESAWHRPRRTALIAIGGALAIAAIGVPIALVLRAGNPAGACPSAEAELAPTQTPALLAQIRAMALSGVGGQRAAAYLETWRAAWRDAYGKTCARPRDQEFHARRSCLSSMRDNLTAMLELTATAPPGAIASVDAVAILPQPGVCFDRPLAVEPAPPADPAVRAEVTRIRSELLPLRIAPRMPPDQSLQRIDPLVAAARATGYDPLLADALSIRGDALQGFDPAAACASHAEAAVVAERAGADAARINALLGQIECARALPARRRELPQLVEQARGLIDRIDDKPHRALLEEMQATIDGEAGDVDGAIRRARAAHGLWDELDAPVAGSRAALVETRLRLHRGEADDLQIGEELMRDALDAVPREATLAVTQLRGTLAELLWQRGRLDEAVAMLIDFAHPAPAGAPVTVEVTDATGAAADGAEVTAAIDPVGDPVRLHRAELRGAATARTDAAGVATLDAPAGGVIVVRKSGELGAAAVPAKAGARVAIKLVPAAYVELAVTTATGAAPADPRQARRGPATCAVVSPVGDRRWTVVAPLDGRGLCRVPALPGRATLAVERTAMTGDTAVAAAPITLVPGRQRAELALARPVSLRVVARPAITGAIVALPGAHAITTWPALAAAMAAAPALTVAAAGDSILDPAPDARVGDGVTALAAPGAGPITVCAVPDASTIDGLPASILAPASPPPRPTCATLTAADGATTTHVLEVGGP